MFVPVNIFHTTQHAPMPGRDKSKAHKPPAREGQKGLSAQILITLAKRQREDTFSLLRRVTDANATPLIETEHFRGVPKRPSKISNFRPRGPLLRNTKKNRETTTSPPSKSARA